MTLGDAPPQIRVETEGKGMGSRKTIKHQSLEGS